MGLFVPLDGLRFGKLVVLQRNGLTQQGKPKWECRCDCGTIKCINGSDLKLGKSKSCGCVSRQKMIARSYRHGFAKRGHLAREHLIWGLMKQRCNNPLSSAYAYYGGRGIRVCDEWNRSFAAFMRDMGRCPRGQSIDRIDNDGHYEPGNCRWATMAVQNNNKRDTTYVTYRGQLFTIANLAKATGVGHASLWRRITKEQQTPEDAVAALPQYSPRKKRIGH